MRNPLDVLRHKFINEKLCMWIHRRYPDWKTMPKWAKRLDDAYDSAITGGEAPGLKTWPLTPLWHRGWLGHCHVKHWWRFHNPKATHEIIGKMEILGRECKVIKGEYCEKHAPPKAVPGSFKL